MDIAVLVNAEGRTSGFEKSGIIKLYSQKEAVWVVRKFMEYQVETLNNSGDLKRCLHNIGEWMGDCKIVVVNRIRGVQYIIFEEQKISMLQISGSPEEFLDYIQGCELHKRVEQEIPLEHVAIFEQKQGHFYTDLRGVMNGKTSYSSRQLLLPFFKKQFESLEIICEHIPKWLQNELPAFGLSYSQEKYKDCFKVMIYPQPSQYN